MTGGCLNHREVGRHLPQQFGGSRLDFGDFAFRMEGCAAVLSRDWRVQQLGAVVAVARGEVATLSFAVTKWFKPR